MDYPADYISHNWPLVALFGLGTPDPTSSDEIELQFPLLLQHGCQISSELPDVAGPAAENLLNCFLDFDARDAAWNNRPGKGKVGTIGFTFRSVGRTLTLPPHKAEALDMPEHPISNSKLNQAPVLHSPISPLSPVSPIFPDGLMTPLWFIKHQLILPSTLIAFFNFTLDDGKSTLQDNKLKNEINAIRTSITSSGYKLRLSVVLVTEDGEVHSEAKTPDRLANIRRATSLEPKSLHVVSHTATLVELRAFVGTVLTALQPACIEYYRDLSKHARRKRSRGSIPPPTTPPISGTSRILSTQGWNVRYETKMGFFAEFRQEMDAACRNYEAAYEALFDGDFLVGNAGWSRRFEEARLLADTLAIRILRCLLWTNQTTSAAVSWTNHRSRTFDLVNRKAKGTTNYGWEAWEARWCKTMAQVIRKVDLPIFNVPLHSLTSDSPHGDWIPNLYAPQEKSYANEQQLNPWDRLHHQGYWLGRAVRHLRARHKMAMVIPQENRAPQRNSTSPIVSDQSQVYDTYLCPEPHVEAGANGSASVDHSGLIVEALSDAASSFSSRQQTRAWQRLQLNIALEQARAGRWQEAMSVVLPLWQNNNWRNSGWWDLVAPMSTLLRDCAIQVHDYERVVATEWELLYNGFSPVEKSASFMSCLGSLKGSTDPPNIILSSSKTSPTFIARFAFERTQGNVGVSELAQLSISSNARANTAPIIFSNIDVCFSGGITDFSIGHSSEINFDAKYGGSNSVLLFESNPAPIGGMNDSEYNGAGSAGDRHAGSATSNLEFNPGQTKIFMIKVTPREAVEANMLRVRLRLLNDSFGFELDICVQNCAPQLIWWVPDQQRLWKRQLYTDNSSSINILPKPPKLELTIPTLRRTYYVCESVYLPISIANNEEDIADVKLVVSLSGGRDLVPALHWATKTETQEAIAPVSLRTSTSRLDELAICGVPQQSTRSIAVAFVALAEPIDLVLEIQAKYTVRSDPQTVISKHFRESVVFIGPFEANYAFKSRVNREPWPSYFLIQDVDETETPVGLKQLWTLDTNIVSFGVDVLVLDESKLYVTESKSGVSCTTHVSEENRKSAIVFPRDMVDRSFDFDVQKTSLEDRRAAAVGFRLDLMWHREEEPFKKVQSSLLVPPLTLPFGEPRVLASAHPLEANPAIISLTYTLENPSTHFLSFSLTMETSDEFAFSGPKMTSMQLVPLSKRHIKYSLLPTSRGVWIRPVLRVIDTGFGEELHPVPANGTKSDKSGLLIWIDVLD